MASIDYLKFYDDENYLMGEVAQKFHEAGTIDPVDFYMLLIWKANRAKGYHKKRLQKKASGSFKEAVSRIATSLWTCAERKERMQILVEDWEFSLPTATAILAILYPSEFTVYDYRVCDELKHDYRPYLSFSASLWAEYEEFQKKVEREAPADLCLRDKDRFLTGRSYRKGIEAECIEDAGGIETI
ncbi:MAG TPA: hypothetical protein VN776_05915 [Terracidiphilus sp.]|nr:hypothetical protein [Terracidiphilus sp.]